jgi:hypothetical protein
MRIVILNEVKDQTTTGDTASTENVERALGRSFAVCAAQDDTLGATKF